MSLLVSSALDCCASIYISSTLFTQDEESMEVVLRAAEALTQFGEDCEVVEREREEC